MALMDARLRCTNDDSDDQVKKLEAAHMPCENKEVKVCRVCHCAESDTRGDDVLVFLDISLPSRREKGYVCRNEEVLTDEAQCNTMGKMDMRCASEFIEFVSPNGEIFICNTESESNLHRFQDTLVHLGCSCKNDLALAHYACALKWFVSHGSTVCEICGIVAETIQPGDFRKVRAALDEYEVLRDRTATGELTRAHAQTDAGVDPAAVAAIRRQMLSEISLWVNPQNCNLIASIVSPDASDQLSSISDGNARAAENSSNKWADKSSWILIAIGLLIVTTVWFIAPHVGKNTGRYGLHILFGGVCALAVVIFLRIVVLSRFKRGPPWYWEMIFIFWFLVFAAWAARTHSARTR